MNEQVIPKAKKSVALSGTVAGNTALCTVGRTGTSPPPPYPAEKDCDDIADFSPASGMTVAPGNSTREASTTSA